MVSLFIHAVLFHNIAGQIIQKASTAVLEEVMVLNHVIIQFDNHMETSDRFPAHEQDAVTMDILFITRSTYDCFRKYLRAHLETMYTAVFKSLLHFIRNSVRAPFYDITWFGVAFSLLFVSHLLGWAYMEKRGQSSEITFLSSSSITALPKARYLQSKLGHVRVLNILTGFYENKSFFVPLLDQANL